jgi:ribonuclease HI
MIVAHFDGACEPKNPGGQMGIGAFIQYDDELLMEFSFAVPANPQNSNNVAEYMGMLSILQWLVANGYTTDEVIIRGDSQLAIKQMNGVYAIHAGRYVSIAMECKQLAKAFTNLTFEWVPREKNTIADDLSKKSLTCKPTVRKKGKDTTQSENNKRSGGGLSPVSFISKSAVMLSGSTNPFDVF